MKKMGDNNNYMIPVSFRGGVNKEKLPSDSIRMTKIAGGGGD